MLGHGGHHADGERIGLGHIGTDKLGPRIPQCKNKGHVPGQPVKLGNQEHGSFVFAKRNGFEQLGSVVFLARLNVGKFGDDFSPVVDVAT